MISVAASLRTWPCFDKSCSFKPCVWRVGMQDVWEMSWEETGGVLYMLYGLAVLLSTADFYPVLCLFYLH